MRPVTTGAALSFRVTSPYDCPRRCSASLLRTCRQGRTKKANSNLAIRIATAAVGAPLIICAALPGRALGLLPARPSRDADRRVGALQHDAPGRPDRRRLMGVGMSAVASLATYVSDGDARVLVTMIVAVPLAGPLLTLVRLGDMQHGRAARRAPWASVRSTSASRSRCSPSCGATSATDGPGYVVLTIMFAWFGDTGGYFAGRFLGQAQALRGGLARRRRSRARSAASPAASFGAMLAHFWFLPSLPLVHGIVLALVAGALGQAGDLGESLLKRSTGVKDSGAHRPGPRRHPRSRRRAAA